MLQYSCIYCVNSWRLETCCFQDPKDRDTSATTAAVVAAEPQHLKSDTVSVASVHPAKTNKTTDGTCYDEKSDSDSDLDGDLMSDLASFCDELDSTSTSESD